MAALVVLPLVVFAHSYRWTGLPIAIGCALAAALARPAILRRRTRWLDVSLVLVLAAMAVQVIPLSPATRSALAPAADAFERQMVVGSDVAASRQQPISLDPTATILAVVIVAAMLLAFWAARSALERGGLRWLARFIATTGLVVAPISVVHHLAVIPALDAIWPPMRRDIRPWGPFVNRNDFSAWLLLALALTLGYLVARLQARHHPGEPFDPERTFDDTGTRLVVALCLMTAGIMVSLSRSGVLATIVGMIVFLGLGRQRVSRRRIRRIAIALVLLLAAGALFADMGALSGRFEVAGSEGLAARLSEWRQVMPMARDFWPVGAGVGAFGRVMPLYQTSTRLITISHADNELLQVAVEGGALVGVPVLLVMATGTWLVWQRLHEDRTAMFAIRAGAASGLVAIAMQNMVEMTLRVPANGLLFAVLAAVATHDRMTSSGSGRHVSGV